MKLYKSMRQSANQDAISTLPPQAQAIVEEVRAQGVVKRDELFSSLEKRFQGSRQTPKNIFAFYRGKLIKEGFMIEVVV